MAASTLPTSPKPTALQPIFENIPQEITQIPQWVLWRYVWNEKAQKWTKPPFQPDSHFASSTNKTTWSTFDVVKKTYLENSTYFDGIGFVFDNDYTGIDKDKNLAIELVTAIGSYAELSPSGNGVHILTRGAVSTEHGRRNGDTEIYFTGRYFTVTGHIIPEATRTIADTNGIVHTTFDSLPAVNSKSAPALDTPQAVRSDDQTNKCFALDMLRVNELLARNNGFAKLWRGNTDSYNSPSEGAWGLLSDLLRITRLDKRAAFMLFKQSTLYQSNPKKYDRTVLEYDANNASVNVTSNITEPTPTTKLQVLTEDQADKLKAPEWVLDGIIVRGQITVISGKKGSFKTFEAIHQTLKVAQMMNTLYIAAEDPIGVGIRRQAWRKHYQCASGVMLTIPQVVRFHDPQEVNDLLDIITLYSIGHITIDTIAACTRGLNENAADDMGKVLEGLERIRDQAGVNLLVLAHESSKNANGIRGWSGIGDASYVEMSAQRVNKSNVVTLKGVRVKMALEQDFTHTLKEVADTLVVTEVKPTFIYPKKEHITLGKQPQKILQIIAETGTKGASKKTICDMFDDPTAKSIGTDLSRLKNDLGYITQERQGTPYIATAHGLAWLGEIATIDEELEQNENEG